MNFGVNAKRPGFYPAIGSEHRFLEVSPRTELIPVGEIAQLELRYG
jgi:hypothetical protein